MPLAARLVIVSGFGEIPQLRRAHALKRCGVIICLCSLVIWNIMQGDMI
jgi:hypothetical protein